MKKLTTWVCILAIVLVACLCSAIIPMMTFAEDSDPQTPVTETVTVVNLPQGISTNAPLVFPANASNVTIPSGSKVNGAGYIDFNNKYGTIKFTVAVEEAGEYYVAVGYVNGGSGGRKYDMEINDISFGTFTCNQNETSYSGAASYHFVKATLNAGDNYVEITRPSSYGSRGAPCISDVKVFPVKEWLSYSDNPTLGGTAVAAAQGSGIDDYGYKAGSSVGTLTWNVAVPYAGTYKIMVPYYYNGADSDSVTVLANGTEIATVGASTSRTGTAWRFLTTEEVALEAGASIPVTLSWTGNKILGGVRLELVQTSDENAYVDLEALDSAMDSVKVTNYTTIDQIQDALNQLLLEYTLDFTTHAKATETTEGLYSIKVTLPDATEYTRDFVIPKVPTMDYAFGLAVPGMAQGTVTVTLPDKDLDSQYALYWGTADGLLDGYTYLTLRDDFKAAQNTLTFKVQDRVLIPEEATHLWLVLDGNRVTSYEIPQARRTTLGTLKYSFGAVADTHLFKAGDANNVKFAEAMDLFESASAHFTLIAGDVVGSATQAYWDDLNAISSNYKQPVFVVPGNHDVLYYWNRQVNAESIDLMLNSVPTYGNEDFTVDGNGHQYKVTKGDTKVDYTVEYGDDLFVYLGVGLVDFSSEDRTKSTDQHLTLEQIEWLKKVLATADQYENVFLVFHYAAFESGFATYSGSDWSMDWSWEHNGYMTEGYRSAEEFYKILKDHPNVIAFSGHTHRNFNGDKNLTVTKNYDFNYEDYTWTEGSDPLGFTAVHIPSSQVNQGYVTYVYDSGVLLSGYDTATGEVIPHANFYLPKTIDDETQALKINAPTTVNVGSNYSLSVDGDQNVTWTLLDGNGLASIDAKGNLKVNGTGTIVIKATAIDEATGLSMESVVSITSKLDLPTLACVGKPLDISLDGIENVTWSILNDEGIATVNSNGILTFSKAGTVTVQATIVDEATGTSVDSTASVKAIDPYAGYAKDATVKGSVTKHTNANNITYFNFDGTNPGRGVVYTVYVEETGNYYADVLYCVGSNSTRNMKVYVNDTVAIDTVNFPRSSTGGWGGSATSTFKNKQICIPLQAGWNQISLIELGNCDGAPQLSDLIVHEPNVGYAKDAVFTGTSGGRHTNSQGVTYFDFGNTKSGQYVTYTVYVDETRDYYVGIGYCLKTNTDRRLQVSVNGVESQAIKFPQNSKEWLGSGGTISYYKVFLPLKAGKNTVVLGSYGNYDRPQFSDIVVYPEHAVQNDLQINLSATLADRTLNAGEITFTLTNGTYTYTATNDENGNAVITVPAAEVRMGTYTVTQSTDVEGITLAEAQTVTVTFSDNGAGGITATASTTPAFKNQYRVPFVNDGVITEDGYFEVNGVPTEMGLFELDGAYYYAQYDGKIIKSQKYYVWLLSDNCGDMTEGWYAFDADGKVVENGLFYDAEGTTWYYENYAPKEKGLFKYGDNYYVAQYDGKIITSKSYEYNEVGGKYYVWLVDDTATDIGKGWRYFDENGLMLQGIQDHPEKEGKYYFVNGQAKEKGLFYYEADKNYYVAQYDGKIITGKYYVWLVDKSAENIGKGWRYFDENGLMLQGIQMHPEKNELYYFVNGQPKEMGLFYYEADDAYYVAQYDGKIITANNYETAGVKGKYYVWKTTNCDNLKGWQIFGADGKMITE